MGKSSWANYVLDRMTVRVPPDSFEPVYLGRDRPRFADFMQAGFRAAPRDAWPRLRGTDPLQWPRRHPRQHR
jgi:hypothetical protein